MVDLDLKDRKILYELDLNCRQSNTQIGKKVGLPRKVVEYRIKRMEEEGIITCYWTAIDTFKLGYQVIRVYINFQDVSTEMKNDLHGRMDKIETNQTNHLAHHEENEKRKDDKVFKILCIVLIFVLGLGQAFIVFKLFTN